jgi:erythronate-4-phosphate dehydrogenase
LIVNSIPHILADDQIPFLEGIPYRLARITRLPGHLIDQESVKTVDALIVRTRTRCDTTLLENSPVSFIGSATIGTDHIDTPYCESRGIRVVNAPGCNAGAVMQYVFTALEAWAAKRNRDLCGKTLGVVGVGNVGKKVVEMANHLGMQTLLNDPPRALAEGSSGFVELAELLTHADIVTLHVPLAPDTRGMADRTFFSSMKKGACLVNTSRGEVVDEEALKDAAKKMGGIILDVWRNEPLIDMETLQITDIATPHIAGYSLEGKRNASQTVIRALANHFGWKELETHTISLPPPGPVPNDLLFTHCFPIFVEDKQLRSAPHQFEAFRKAYVYRREWTPEQYRQLTLCLPKKIWHSLNATD